MVATVASPILFGSMLFTLRHRIRTLETHKNLNEALTYEEEVGQLRNAKHELTHELENMKSEMSDLKVIASPRELTEAEEKIILATLSDVKPTTVVISAYAFDDESAGYATQIGAVLRKAHWEVYFNKASMNEFKGITVTSFKKPFQELPGQRELAKAFLAAGLRLRQIRVRPDSIAGPLQDGAILIVVGSK